MSLKRFLLSSILFLVSILLLYGVYIYKYQYKSDEKVEISNNIKFRDLINVLDLHSMFPNTVEVKDGNFKIYFLNDTIFNSKFDKPNKITHFKNEGSKSIAIYSLSFVRNILLNNNFDQLSPSSKEKLDKIIKQIIQQGKKIPLTNPYILGDHAVSDRLETLLLYKVYCQEKGINFEFDREISQLTNLLQEPYYFKYTTNHGLMQLRAQLMYAMLTKNKTYAEEIQQKIHEIIPIFVADDGSILEAGAHYHLYINKQFQEYNELLKLLNIEDSILNNNIKKQERYNQQLVNHKGFLQGFGDSYSNYINKSLIDYDNSIFRYRNKIAGSRIANTNDTISTLFISLDNKPHVHKLKEDLAFYLYFNRPFFSNTGTYSYDLSDDRNFIQNKISQNGPKFISDEIIYSDVNLRKKNGSIQFIGKAYNYSKVKSIQREILINKEFNEIFINDSSTINFISQFVIHPEINVQRIDEKNLILHNKNDSVYFFSNHNIDVTDTWISPKLMQKQTTKVLKIKGKNVKSKLLLNHTVDNIPYVIKNNPGEYNKELSILSFDSKYKYLLFPFYFNLYLIIYLCLFLLFLLLGLFMPRIRKSIQYINYIFCLLLLHDAFFGNFIHLNIVNLFLEGTREFKNVLLALI